MADIKSLLRRETLRVVPGMAVQVSPFRHCAPARFISLRVSSQRARDQFEGRECIASSRTMQETYREHRTQARSARLPWYPAAG